MEIEKLKSIIESILFVSGEPVAISKIEKIVGTDLPIQEALENLLADYSKERGMVIIRKDDSIQLVSNPENASFLDELVKSEIQENLSKAALEVLSIVAYRGPIGRIDIEAIRGVNCSFTLRSLLMRGLLERIDNPKDSRGYLYKISFDFLRKLGLKEQGDLPDFETLSSDGRIDTVLGNN